MLGLYVSSVPIEKAAKTFGKELVVKGWIYRKRSSGGKAFAILRDRTGTLQCVADKGRIGDMAFDALDKAYLESSIIVKGAIRKDERAPGGVELDISELRIVNSGEQFPITEYQSPEFLLDVRHLWLRSQKMMNIMKARAEIFKYARECLDKQGFLEISPPLITRAGGETGASMFEVQYFEQKAYLTESSQLYAEAMVPVLEKVYTFAPSYRAEKSRTVKHLTEYWHLEPEAAYYNLDKIMKLQEKLASYIAQRLSKEEELLNALGVEKDSLLKIKPPFNRITYDKAIEIIQEKGSKKVWGDDLGVEEERLLTEHEDKPMFVYAWPKELKAFYASINPKDERTVMAADMQAPRGHGELTSSSERVWQYDELMKRMDEVEKAQHIKFDRQNYAWWIDLRKFGSVPHAGFGIGMERLIKWMLNLEHIRDAVPFPRVINRITP